MPLTTPLTAPLPQHPSPNTPPSPATLTLPLTIHQVPFNLFDPFRLPPTYCLLLTTYYLLHQVPFNLFDPFQLSKKATPEKKAKGLLAEVRSK